MGGGGKVVKTIKLFHFRVLDRDSHGVQREKREREREREGWGAVRSRGHDLR